VRTDGARAYAAARRILEIDPSDLDARLNLGYFERAYGWQFGAPFLEGREHAEELVRVDSTSIPILLARAAWAIALGDTADQRVQLARIERSDTTGTLGRGWRAALRAMLATDEEFRAQLPALSVLPAAERIAVFRGLRWVNPARAESMFVTMRRSTDPTAVATAEGEIARFDIARGWSSRVDSAISAGGFRENAQHRALQRMIIAAALAGVGQEDATARAVQEQAEYIPADSALAYFQRYPVWWAGWLVGAYHAAFGDTLIAQRWISALETLPRGGPSLDYVAALQADIDAWLASRRGDPESALGQARRAYELWTIHADNNFEHMPSPMIRFHLGVLYRQAGRPDSAIAMFRSLVPPTTWMGFLTARAAFELGELEQERGDRAMAVFHYTRALQIWEQAGPGAEAWLTQTRDRLARIGSR
jgi:hypothetical protein